MAVLKHVKAKWASLIEPNTTYDSCWEVVAILSEEQAALFASKGVPVKTDSETGEKFYRFKIKTEGNKKSGGTYTREAPKVLDAHKKPWDGRLIGNGSIVNIQYNFKDWSMMGNSGTKAELLAVQVIELVPFGGGGEEFEDEGDTKVLHKEAASDDFDDEDVPY